MSKAKEPKTVEPYFRRLRNEENRQSLLDWWRSLERNTGARAQLRRAAIPEEVALHPQMHQIRRLVKWASIEAAATIAGILSHIRSGENDPAPFGQKLAKAKKKGGSAPFSETRFRQLLKSRNWNELYRNLRRAIQVLDRNVNPLIVTDLILCWDREFHKRHDQIGERSLKFWLSRDYYTEAMKHEKTQQ